MLIAIVPTCAHTSAHAAITPGNGAVWSAAKHSARGGT